MFLKEVGSDHGDTPRTSEACCKVKHKVSLEGVMPCALVQGLLYILWSCDHCTCAGSHVMTSQQDTDIMSHTMLSPTHHKVCQGLYSTSLLNFLPPFYTNNVSIKIHKNQIILCACILECAGFGLSQGTGQESYCINIDRRPLQ